MRFSLGYDVAYPSDYLLQNTQNVSVKFEVKEYGRKKCLNLALIPLNKFHLLRVSLAIYHSHIQLALME